MKHILIVDDEKSIRNTVSEFLKEVGYKVEIAKDAKEALQLLKINDFDVVVSDIVLPHITGVELLKSIKENSPHIQIILMTGEPNLESASEAVRSGAFDYLTKPITKEKIIRIVNQAIKVKEIDDERRKLEIENKEYQINLEKLVLERTKSLTESENKYNKLIENVPDAILIYSEGKIVFVNNESLNLFGAKKSAELIGKEIFEFIHPDYLQIVLERIEKTIRDNIVLKEARMKIIGVDGSIVDVEVRGLPIVFKSKQGIQIIVRDITEQLEKERELKESKAFFEQLFQQSAISAQLIDIDGWTVDLNQNFSELFGVKKEDMVGNKYNIFQDTEASSSGVVDKIKWVIGNKKPISLEIIFDIKKAADSVDIKTTAPVQKWFQLSISPILDDENKIVYIMLQQHDITDRKLSEIELKELRDSLSTAQKIAQVGNWGLDLSTNLTTWSDELYSIYGISKNDKNSFEVPNKLIHKDDIEKVKEAMEVISSDRPLPTLFYRIVLKDGTIKHVHAIAERVYDEDGKTIKLIGTVQDITELKEKEDKLIESEGLYRSVFENSPIGIMQYNKNGICEKVNSELENILGASRGKLIGFNLLKNLRDEEMVAAIASSLEKGTGYFNNSYTSVLGNKTTSLIIRFKGIKNKKNEIIGGIAIAEDVTEQKLNEKALSDSREKYRMLIKNIPQRIFYKDRESTYLVASPNYADDLGISVDDLIGKTDYDFYPKELAEKYRIDDKAVIESGKIKEVDESYLVDGHFRTIHTVKTPFTDEKNNIIGLFGVFWDISERKIAEKAMHESETKLKEAQRIAKVGHWELDIVKNNLIWSDEIYRIFNLEPQQFEVTYEAFLENIHPDDRDRVNKAYTDSLENKTPYEIEHRLKLSDGKIKYVNEKCETEFDEKGKPLISVGTVQDITEQKYAEEALRESEERFSRLSNLTSEGIVIHDKGVAIDLNLSLTKMLDYEKEELIGKNFIKLIVPKEYWPELNSRLKQSHAQPYEAAVTKKNGTTFPVELEGKDYLDKDGNLVRVTLVRDITLRKQNELEIRKLTNAIEQSLTSIVITDTDGNIEYVNKYFTEVTGYTKEEALGQNPRILKTDYFGNDVYKKMWKTISSGETWTGEFRNRKRNGEFYWEKTLISPIKNNYGEIVNYVAIKEDITEWKRIEDERLHLEKIVQASVNELYVFDKKTYKFLYLNDSALRNIGYSFEEMKLMTPLDIAPEINVERFKNYIEPLVRGEKKYVKFQTKHQRKDKSSYYVDVSIQIVKQGSVKKFVAIIIDITKRKMAERELLEYQVHLEELVNKRTLLLRESEETFRAIAENSDDSIMRFDKNGKHLYVNPIVSEQTGIRGSEFIGKTHEELGFPKKLCKLWKNAILDVFKSGKKNRIEFMLPNNIWIDWSLLPEMSSEGLVTVVITFGRDITGRKMIENKIKKALEKEKELNQLKDQFMSTVSHDLRTPLTAIQSSVELMERFYGKWDKELVITKYGQIKDSVARITDMLGHVMELSKIERGKIKTNFEMVNLKNEFQIIINEIDLVKNKNHQLIFNYKLDKEEFRVDINLLREILINLLTNGIKYSPNGGKVELFVESKDGYLILEISDEGIGINSSEIDNIFNDFYRADGSQNISGSGLGLSIVKHYVEMYNGKIEVESKFGEGSLFRVKIPQRNS